MTSRFAKRPAAASKRRNSLPSRSVELTITELGARGDGIASHDGQSVFVPFTVPGERVEARIDGRRGDGLTASAVKILEPAALRCQALCPHYVACGGCSVQHIDHTLYVEWKRDLLVTPLVRQGFDEALIEPLICVPAGQRRRASFAFIRRRADTILGFHGRSSHQIIDLQSCLQLQPAMVAILPALRTILTEIVPAGEEGEVVMVAGENGLDLLVVAEARLDLFDREELAAFAEQHDIARLSWQRSGDAFIDPISRRRPAMVQFGQHRAEPPPGGFLQPTQAGEQAIAAIILAAVQTHRRVADLYCGCGSFTLPLAAAGHQVHGLEGDDGSIASLKAASNAQGLNILAETRDLVRRPLLSAELDACDAVIFDPPRAGAAAQAEQLAAHGPAKVVAVSCNPATLARDLRMLVNGGYRIERIVPIDQFPYSAHLEAVAVLSR